VRNTISLRSPFSQTIVTFLGLQETSGTHEEAGFTCNFATTLYLLTDFLAVTVAEKTDERCSAGTESPGESPTPSSGESPTPSPTMSRGLMTDVRVPVALAAVSSVAALIL